MTEPPPPPRSPNCAPPKVTQDSPLQGYDDELLSHHPNDGFDDWSPTDTALVVAMMGSHNDRLKSCIVTASAAGWGIEDMFPAQLDAIYCLLQPVLPDHLAVIQRTGPGKTHILWTLGVMKRGIILIFIPLLTLSANVMSKFKCANPRIGAVVIQHLDKIYDTNRQVYRELLERCRRLLWLTTTTLFIFLSPLFLINHTDTCHVFIECSHCTTLRVVALNEAHFHVQHGTSFRSEILALQVHNCAKNFGNQSRMKRPRLIAMTTTLPKLYLAPLC